MSNSPNTQTTVAAVLNRIGNMKSSCVTAVEKLKYVNTALDQQLLRSQGDLATDVIGKINEALSEIETLIAFYTAQEEKITAVQPALKSREEALEKNAIPSIPAAAAPVRPKTMFGEFTEEELATAPRPGTPAWRVLHRSDPDRAAKLLHALQQQAKAEAPIVEVDPVENTGIYDHMVPSHAAIPEQKNTTRRAPERPAKTLDQVAPVEIKAPARAVSKLPDPIPREPKPAPSIPTPPSFYQRLTEPELSPLYRAFAPAPWLDNGKGTITVGTAGWTTEYMEGALEDLHGFDLIRKEQGFYCEQGQSIPTAVMIRLRTFALIWYFGDDVGDLMVYQVGLSDGGSNDHRWFPAHTLPSSSTGRLLTELNTYLGIDQEA